ncbi:hypothetical protein, partial [Vibrio sinaloensis]|uniref:hypothetical protein n=2 Tax=Photobacterium sp. (strain ATCC 43367) TaxID=379097 RepID=UPI002F3F5186
MKFNLLFSLFLKALSMCLGFISIPLYIGYFGNDSVLGLWFSILSILTWTMYFDLGVGNGLKNEMIKLISDGSIAYARKLFIKSILFLSVFSFSLSFLVIAGFIVFYFWGSFEFKGIERDEFYLSMLVLAIAMFLQFPLKLGISCILSFQKSALSNVPLCLTQLLVVIYLYLMADIVSSKFFLYLSLFYAVSLVLPLSISLLYGLFLLKEGKTYNKVGGVSNRAFVDKVVFPGIGFFSIQILLLLVTGSNEFFILHLFGGEQVVEYQVYYRLYSIGLVFFTTLCIPFWGYL